MVSRPPLEIVVTFRIAECSLPELERFHAHLDAELSVRRLGSCGPPELTAAGLFQFSCSLSNLHEGLNHFGRLCLEMIPRPAVRVTLYGQDQYPIGIFPNNDLQAYLPGLEGQDSDENREEVEET